MFKCIICVYRRPKRWPEDDGGCWDMVPTTCPRRAKRACCRVIQTVERHLCTRANKCFPSGNCNWTQGIGLDLRANLLCSAIQPGFILSQRFGNERCSSLAILGELAS